MIVPTLTRWLAWRGCSMRPIAAGDRMEWLDLGRGLCMVLVVIMHVHVIHYLPLFRHSPFRDAWTTFIDIAQPIRMPTFFAISGFLAARAIWRPWKDAFQKRVLLLSYVYAVWLLISLLIAHSFRMQWSSDVAGGLPREFVAELIYPQTILWYLYALVGYFLVARFARDLPLAVTLSAAVLLAIMSDLLPTPQAARLARNLLFFLIGGYLPAALNHIAQRASARSAMLSASAFAAMMGLAWMAGSHVPGITLPASLAGIWLCLTVSKLMADSWAAPHLMEIGRRTLPIFLLHGLIIDMLNRTAIGPAGAIFQPVRTHMALAAIYPLAASALVIVVSLMIHRLLLSIGQDWLFALPTPWRRQRLPVPA